MRNEKLRCRLRRRIWNSEEIGVRSEELMKIRNEKLEMRNCGMRFAHKSITWGERSEKWGVAVSASRMILSMVLEQLWNNRCRHSQLWLIQTHMMKPANTNQTFSKLEAGTARDWFKNRKRSQQTQIRPLANWMRALPARACIIGGFVVQYNYIGSFSAGKEIINAE